MKLSLLQKIGAIPYTMALSILRWTLRLLVKPGIEVWARNSYVLGTLQPFKSDLDVTVWFGENPTQYQTQRLLTSFSLASKIFPVLSEMNVYVSKHSSLVLQLMNPLEIERDPRLFQKLSSYSLPRKANGADACIFFLRMLEGDIENVIFRPEMRKRKWESHVKAVSTLVQRPLSPLWKDFPKRTLLRALVEIAVQLLELPDSMQEARAIEALECYFQCIGRGVPVHVLNPFFLENDWWWPFLPHRFCFDPLLIQRKEKPMGKLQDVFIGQISWEVNGLLGQFFLAKDKNKLHTHLRSLQDALKTTTTAPAQQLNTTIDSLLSTI